MSNPNTEASHGLKVNDIVLIMPNALPMGTSDRNEPVIIAFDNPPLAQIREIRATNAGGAIMRCRVLRSTDIAIIAAQTRTNLKPTVARDPEMLICNASGVMPRPVLPHLQ